MKNIKWLKTLALVLAAALIVSVGFLTSGKVLKAADGDDVIVENPVEAAPEEVVQEIVIPAEEQPAEEQPAEEQPAEEQPAEEQPAEEQPAEEQLAEEQPAEEQPAEEQPAEEQPATEQSESAKQEEVKDSEENNAEKAKKVQATFDVELANSHYSKLDDAQKEEYLNSLSPEDKEMLLTYIKDLETPEEKAEEKAEEKTEEKNVELWYDYSGKLGYGTEITICSNIKGYSPSAHYQWVYSADGGKTWNNIPGANSATYKFILNKENNWYSWDLRITE